MSGFLTDLADACRRAGVQVEEWPGWRTRTRGGDPHGYRDGRPNHIMVHHTASGPASDGRGDCTYIWDTSDTRPIYNLYVARTGKVFVGAAGPSNNAGKGSTSSRDGDSAWNGAGVPDDGMNSWSIAITVANDGTGEPYPKVQTDALVAVVRQLQATYSIPTERVRDHREWTYRKVDMHGPSPWSSGGRWDMDRFRASLGSTPPTPPAGGAVPPPVTPSPVTLEDDTMFLTIDRNGSVWVGNGISRRTISNEREWDHLIWGAAATGRAARDWRTGAEVFNRNTVTRIPNDGDHDNCLASLGAVVG